MNIGQFQVWTVRKRVNSTIRPHLLLDNSAEIKNFFEDEPVRLYIQFLHLMLDIQIHVTRF
jgi:hypothetical protein